MLKIGSQIKHDDPAEIKLMGKTWVGQIMAIHSTPTGDVADVLGCWMKDIRVAPNGRLQKKRPLPLEKLSPLFITGE